MERGCNYQSTKSDKVFLNGQWIGNHNTPNELLLNIRGMRRNNQIPKEYSILRDIDKREIKIYTDGGRVQRAMFIVEENEIKLKPNLASRSEATAHPQIRKAPGVLQVPCGFRSALLQCFGWL